MQETGKYIFGLNSNRSIEDMLGIADAFSIKGPVVGENGVFAYFPATKKIEYFLTPSQLEILKLKKYNVETVIRRSLEKHFSPSEVIWKDVDTVESISGDMSSNDYQEGTIVILNNVYRKYTTSAHIFISRNNKLEKIPSGKVESILKEVRSLIQDTEMTLAYDFNFSNILMYTTLTSKRIAVEKLLSLYPGLLLYSIGDDVNDYLMTKNIGRFLTTNNAKSVVKKHAQFVADKNFAQGVTQILTSLPDQLRYEDVSTIQQLEERGYKDLKAFAQGETAANLYLGRKNTRQYVIKLGSIYGDNSEIIANKNGYAGLKSVGSSDLLPDSITHDAIDERMVLVLPYLGKSVTQMDRSDELKQDEYILMTQQITRAIMASIHDELDLVAQQKGLRVVVNQIQNWLVKLTEAGFLPHETDMKLSEDNIPLISSTSSSLMILDFTPDNLFFHDQIVSFIDPWDQSTYRGSFVPSFAQFMTLAVDIMRLPGAVKSLAIFDKEIHAIGAALSLNEYQIKAQVLLGRILQYALSCFVRMNSSPDTAHMYASKVLQSIDEYDDICKKLRSR